jgi:hypothetical protein
MKTLEIVIMVIIVIAVALFFFGPKMMQTNNPGGMCILSNKNDPCPKNYPDKSCISIGNGPMICQCCDVPR